MPPQKKQYSLEEISTAMRLINERIMVPPYFDLLRRAIEHDTCEAMMLEIRWDQWAECTITCYHGEWKAKSDFLNLTEALLRAIRLFQEGDHTDVCGKTYVDRTPLPDGTIKPLEIDCALPQGHEGECDGS